MPQGILPCTVSESRVREQFQEWCASQSLAPGALAQGVRVDTMAGVYVPYWICGAKVHCGWDAQAGYVVDDLVYHDRDTTLRRRRDRQIRWEPAAGFIDHVFDDVLTPATTSIRRDLLKGLEPWPIALFLGALFGLRALASR